jgi:methionine-rich copper-binding protein CopC
MTRRLFAAPLLAASTLFAAPAWAHAFLDHASPAVGSTVPTSPASLSLWFTQALEPAFSSATVTDSSGASVDAGPVQVDTQDPTLMHVPVKKLPPGTYKVKWHVVSVDTHTTQGDFSFTVGQ